MIEKTILYSILLIPIVVLLFAIVYIALKAKKLPSGFLALSVAALSISLFAFCLFDTGYISRYVVNMGGRTYYVSPNALEEVILKNIDNLGLSLARVYQKYYIVEKFDCSKESETVNLIEQNGAVYIKLKLKYKPVISTVQTFLSSGWHYSPSFDEDRISEDNKGVFYWSRLLKTDNIDKVKTDLKDSNLIAEIRYFRQVE